MGGKERESERVEEISRERQSRGTRQTEWESKGMRERESRRAEEQEKER